MSLDVATATSADVAYALRTTPTADITLKIGYFSLEAEYDIAIINAPTASAPLQPSTSYATYIGEREEGGLPGIAFFVIFFSPPIFSVYTSSASDTHSVGPAPIQRRQAYGCIEAMRSLLQWLNF